MSYSKIVCTLALSLGSSVLATAQQADTLKRQLRVLTHQDEVLSEREALPLSFDLPKPSKARAVQLKPTALRPYIPAYNFEPLSALSPLKDFYNRDRQRGYITLGVGLQYNAYLSGAVRAIDAKQQTLDIQLDGHYSHHRLMNYGAERVLREQVIGLKGDYKHSFNTGFELGLSAKYLHDKHNYYGYIGAVNPTSPTNTPYLQSNQFALEASFGLSKPQLYSLAYHFKPSLTYTQAVGASTLTQNQAGRELQLGIDGELKYLLEQEHYIGMDVSARSYNYNSNTNAHGVKGYQNGSLISLKPHWHYSSEGDWDWGVSLGLGLDFYTQAGKQATLISPYAKAYARFSPNVALRLDFGGGVQMNSLSNMLKEMPYLAIGEQAMPTQIPIEGKLSLDALLQPNLKLTSYVGYTKYKGAINYLYTAQGLFSPENTDATMLRIGAMLDYRFAPTLILKAQATYNHWSKNAQGVATLYARPQLELLAELSYRPLQKLECIFAAEIKQGMHQGLETSTGIASTAIPAISHFRLSANYQIHKRWALGAKAHLLANRESTRYYGYLPQRFTTTLLATYKF